MWLYTGVSDSLKGAFCSGHVPRAKCSTGRYISLSWSCGSFWNRSLPLWTGMEGTPALWHRSMMSYFSSVVVHASMPASSSSWFASLPASVSNFESPAHGGDPITSTRLRHSPSVMHTMAHQSL